MNTELSKNINALPPAEKVNVRSFVLAIIALSGVVYFLYTVVIGDNKAKVEDLKQQVIEIKEEYKISKTQDSIRIVRLEFKIDSITVKYYNLSIDMYRKKLETVNYLKESIKNQKKILK